MSASSGYNRAMQPAPDLPLPPSSGFSTTHWSIVVRAGQPGGREAEEALAFLCRRYWYPLYGYVRRLGHEVADAQDLTQAFFARLLEKNALGLASPERGRFRSFLLTALKNFLANERDRARARKRGGGRPPLTLDLEQGEARLRLEPAHSLTPERLFEKEWALRLLELVLDRLRQEFAAAGKDRQFEQLQGALAGDRDALDYGAVASALSLTEAAARQAVHRLRKRYRELLRDEIARTLADPAEVEEEIRNLFAALGI